MIALLLPTETEKELWEGRDSLAETVHVREVIEEEVTVQGCKSMRMVGVAKFKYLPVIVRGYPPKTSPVVLDRD